MGRFRRGIDSRINLLVCLRSLQTGRSYDNLDCSARLGEETILHYVRMLMGDLITIYGKTFLK